jgi:uncharacterized membrane protein YdjX (TVP38/TMEM64 family)
MKEALTEIGWKVVAVIALVGCTGLGWYLYEIARDNRFDNTAAEWVRTAIVTVQVAFRLDPILTLIFFPLGILVVLILGGLLIWMNKDS